MHFEKRKLLTIVTEAVIEDELLRELDANGVQGYTVSDARGRGARGERRAGWRRDANIRVEVVCRAELAQRLVQRLEERFLANYAMILTLTDVEVLRGDKF